MEDSTYIFALSGLFNAGVAFLYGAYVLLKKGNDSVVRLYFLMSISIMVWGIGYWKWLLADNPVTALFWIKVLTFGSFFIPLFYLHWILRLLGSAKKTLNILVLCVAYIVVVVGTLGLSSTLIVEGVVERSFFEYWPIPGPLYGTIIGMLYFGVVSFAIIKLALALKNEIIPNRKTLLRFLLIGSLIGFMGGATNFPLWYNIPILPYGNFLVAFFPIIFGYASFRHKLFNIKVVSAELLILVIVGVLLFQLMYAENVVDFWVRLGSVILVTLLASLVMKQMYHEIEIREKGERLARYLANANARLRELDKQKTEFVSIASHQLRAPIAAIKGYSSMVLEGTYGDVPAHLQDPLNRVLESGKRIAIIVDDFLNVTRIEQGRMVYTMSNVNLCALVKDVAHDLAVIAKNKKLDFQIVIPEPCEIPVHVDDGKIRQVCSNILDNAIKYTNEGFVRVEVSVAKNHDAGLVTIIDSGIGIPQDEQVNMFHKFSRASNANESTVHGTGLGLYIAKEIARAHNGWIHVSSPGVGKGTTFTLELPLVQNSERV